MAKVEFIGRVAQIGTRNLKDWSPNSFQVTHQRSDLRRLPMFVQVIKEHLGTRRECLGNNAGHVLICRTL